MTTHRDGKWSLSIVDGVVCVVGDTISPTSGEDVPEILIDDQYIDTHMTSVPPLSE